MTDINTQTGKFYENKEKARRNESLKTTTGKIMKAMGRWAAEIGLVKKLDASAEEAHAAWVTAQAYDKRQEDIARAEMRAKAAYASTFKDNISKGS